MLQEKGTAQATTTSTGSSGSIGASSGVIVSDGSLDSTAEQPGPESEQGTDQYAEDEEEEEEDGEGEGEGEQQLTEGGTHYNTRE